jgi:hypothetical protein
MANTSTTHVIEIETGIGEPAFIPLTLGQELQPISVGKKGMWRIESPRVLDVHAFMYFDGAALFVQSADEGASASVDGHPVGKAWTELHAPCHIEIGGARLRYRSLRGDAPPRSRRPPPPDRPVELGLYPPRAPGDGSGETNVMPSSPSPFVGQPQEDRWAAYDHAQPAAPTPVEPVHAVPMTSRLGAMQPPFEPDPQTPAYQMMPPPSHPGTIPPGVVPGGYTMHHGPSLAPPPPPEPGWVTKYKELSVPKRILIVLAPFCLAASVYLLMFDDPPGRGTPTATVPSACPPGFVPYSIPAASGVIPCVPVGTPMPPSAPPIATAPRPVLTAPPVVTAPPPVVTAPPPAPPQSAPPMTSAPPPPVAMPPPVVDAGKIPDGGGAKTLERQAVDAVAVNDYLRAAAIYDALHAQNPGNRVYAEAARILRMKADGGL